MRYANALFSAFISWCATVFVMGALIGQAFEGIDGLWIILFDQLSRPYYPPEESPDEVDLDVTEAGALRQYFEFLFAETERQRDLQVIVLEHAYFHADAKFVEAVGRERWNKTDRKLIPSDWPCVS